LWPGGARLRCGPGVGAALDLSRERYDADKMPGMPFAQEHYLALWQEYYTRLLNDPAAQFEWRPPRPEDHARVNPFLARPAETWNFDAPSLAAARRDEAERLAAEARPPPPFADATAEVAERARRRQLAAFEAERETAASKFRREKAEREAERAELERTVAAAEAAT
jgi:hypothetical protein